MRRRMRSRRRRTILINSNNPHLAGGEQETYKRATTAKSRTGFSRAVFGCAP